MRISIIISVVCWRGDLDFVLLTGRFTYRTKEILPALEAAGCVALRYLDDRDRQTQRYPFNPNGSEGE